MCDTMVALGNSTADGSIILAKNADRQPNERLLTLRVPRRTYPDKSKLQCSYIEIDQVGESYEVLLLKPHWIWGAEMGANEYGLNIGNEAIFSREKKEKTGLIGMDLVRLALERCRNCREAIQLITDLLAVYGQGGNCGYEKPFYYHNAFLLADPSEAWILETAGIYWAARKVKDIAAISNCLSIGKDFDLSHPDLVSHALARGWCRKEADFHFARAYTEPVFTYFSGAARRRGQSLSILEAQKGKIDLKVVMEALRSHRPAYRKKAYRRSSVSSVCMHAGFIYGDQTTGCYVVSIKDRKEGQEPDLPVFQRASYWISGGGPPCLSLMKPFYWLEAPGLVFAEGEEDQAMAAWERREAIHRMVLENRIDPTVFQKDRDLLESAFFQKARELEEVGRKEDLALFTREALLAEEALLDQYLDQGREQPSRIRGNPYFRHYWKKMNAKYWETSTKEG